MNLANDKLTAAYRRLRDAEELYPPTHPTVWGRRLTVELMRAAIAAAEGTNQ